MFEFNTAWINRGDRAGDFRQLVVSILLQSSTFQIAIRGFTPCKCGRKVLRRSFLRSERVKPRFSAMTSCGSTWSRSHRGTGLRDPSTMDKKLPEFKGLHSCV